MKPKRQRSRAGKTALADRIRIPITGARLSVENARRHTNGAELLAASGLFGMAISHLVLAAEEGGKAHMLADEAHRNAADSSTTTDWRTYMRALSKHGFKQAVAQVESWSYPRTFMLELAQAGVLTPGANLDTSQTEEMAKMHSDILPPAWPGNDLKKAGLYVDLSEGEPFSWRTPADFTEPEWALERDRVLPYVAHEEQRVEFLEAVLTGRIWEPSAATQRAATEN